MVKLFKGHQAAEPPNLLVVLGRCPPYRVLALLTLYMDDFWWLMSTHQNGG